MTTAIILNGKCLDFEVKDDYIICADGGYRLLGKKPDCVIGDFDSLAEIPKDVKVQSIPPLKIRPTAKYA